MIRRLSQLRWHPVLLVASQLVLAVAITASGGGDFPLRR